MTTHVKPGQYMVVANSSPADRGDLVAVADTDDEAYLLARRSGYHMGVLTLAVAGDDRTPRGAELDQDPST